MTGKQLALPRGMQPPRCQKFPFIFQSLKILSFRRVSTRCIYVEAHRVATKNKPRPVCTRRAKFNTPLISGSPHFVRTPAAATNHPRRRDMMSIARP
jgi:hypothetical protein